MSEADPPATRPASTAEQAPAAELAFDWRAALAEHQQWLRLVVLARLGESAAVGDVMQEVALAAGRGASKLRDPSKTAPWLYRLAVTAVLQHRRKAGRRRNLADRYQQKITPADLAVEADPLDWLLAEEQRGLVRRALASLPSRDAEVLLLKYTQDWSYAQLAEHLGVSESAIDGRLQRARKKLRAALRQADPSLVEAG
ncbi:MAG: sigma-70 family RNA polymerase sigma factor [Planctomycetota bacterium]